MHRFIHALKFLLCIFVLVTTATTLEARPQEKPDNIWKPANRKSARSATSGVYGKPTVAQKKYRKGELLVGYTEGLSKSALSEKHKIVRATPIKHFRKINIDLVKLPEGVSVEQGIEKYKKINGVRFVEPNYILSIADFGPSESENHRGNSRNVATAAQYFPNDPLFNQQWALHNTGQTGGTDDADTDAPEAWMVTKGDSDIIVAVIDSGVDYTHEDLANQMWINTAEKNGVAGVDDDGNGFIDDIYGYDFANDDGDPFDDLGHGTLVAGIIAAQQDNGIGISGIAPGVRIMALKFMDDFGFSTTADAVSCFEYARDMGASITNNSWYDVVYSQALKDAITSYGKPTICAAGDYHLNNDNFGIYPANYDNENIISVLATTHDDVMAESSDYGRLRVDIGAPGEDILSCFPGDQYKKSSGTSMATPQVSGVIALLISQYGNISNAQILDYLYANGDVLTSLTFKCELEQRLNANLVNQPSDNHPPEATNMALDGDLLYGSTIQARYDYQDEENDPEGDSVISWFIADGPDKSVDHFPLEAQGQSLLISSLYAKKYVAFSVRPKATSGTPFGLRVNSPWFGPISSLLPLVTTVPVPSTGATAAQVFGSVKLTEGQSITERGFVYSQVPEATIDDNKVLAGSGTGDFNATLSGLTPENTFYFRAYAKNDEGIGYGEERSFSTMPTGITKVDQFIDDRDGHFGIGVIMADNQAMVIQRNYDPVIYCYSYNDNLSFWQNDNIIHPNLYFSTYGIAADMMENKALFGGNDGRIKYYKRNFTTGKWEYISATTLPSSAEISTIKLSGNLAIAGCCLDNGNIDGSGAAYILELDNNSDQWIVRQKLIADEGEYYDQFGLSVAINDKYAFAGAPNDNDIKNDSGCVYVFEYIDGSWIYTNKLYDPTSNNYEYMGTSLSLFDDTLVVGASDISFGRTSGSAIIYKLNSSSDAWVFKQEIVSNDPNERFGQSVSVNVDSLVVGASRTLADDDTVQGAVYFYIYDKISKKWMYVKQYHPILGQQYDVFGHTVVVNGDFIAVGAPAHSLAAPQFGYAYFINIHGFFPECIVNCDVNGDGLVTPGDALLVFKHYLGINLITDPCALRKADANGDNNITPGDALFIFKEYLGLN